MEVELNSMSFPELVAYILSRDDLVGSGQWATITKRLYEVALYDNHTDSVTREAASKMLGYAKARFEALCYVKNDTGTLNTFRQLNAKMESNACVLGVGSLSWMIIENNIKSDDICEYIAKPEHSHLLENFYACLDEATALKMRNYVFAKWGEKINSGSV